MPEGITSIQKPELKPGASICAGKYRLSKILGEGSFGVVWLAEEIETETQQAIKYARAGSEAAKAFTREEKLSKKISIRIFYVQTHSRKKGTIDTWFYLIYQVGHCTKK